jgi:hypothetical protein
MSKICPVSVNVTKVNVLSNLRAKITKNVTPDIKKIKLLGVLGNNFS